MTALTDCLKLSLVGKEDTDRLDVLVDDGMTPDDAILKLVAEIDKEIDKLASETIKKEPQPVAEATAGPQEVLTELETQSEADLVAKKTREQDQAIAAKEQADREVGLFDLQQQVDDTPPAPPADMFGARDGRTGQAKPESMEGATDADTDDAGGMGDVLRVRPGGSERGGRSGSAGEAVDSGRKTAPADGDIGGEKKLTPKSQVGKKKPKSQVGKKRSDNKPDTVYSIISRDVFRETVVDSIQNDGQQVLDAVGNRDINALKRIAIKYQKEAGRNQGGGGAGPGKVKQPRRGAEPVFNAANIAIEWLASKPDATKEPEKSESKKEPQPVAEAKKVTEKELKKEEGIEKQGKAEKAAAKAPAGKETVAKEPVAEPEAKQAFETKQTPQAKPEPRPAVEARPVKPKKGKSLSWIKMPPETVEVAETGKTAVIEETAEATIDRVDSKLNNLYQLMGCLKA